MIDMMVLLNTVCFILCQAAHYHRPHKCYFTLLDHNCGQIIKIHLNTNCAAKVLYLIVHGS